MITPSTMQEETVWRIPQNPGRWSTFTGRVFLLPALEEGLAGKSEGEEVTITLTAEEAYGERDESLSFQIPREDFEDPESIQQGDQVKVHDGERGGTMTVVSTEDELISLDGNHPLAGKELVYSFAIRKVQKTIQEHIDALERHGCCRDSHNGGCCRRGNRKRQTSTASGQGGPEGGGSDIGGTFLKALPQQKSD